MKRGRNTPTRLTIAAAALYIRRRLRKLPLRLTMASTKPEHIRLAQVNLGKALHMNQQCISDFTETIPSDIILISEPGWLIHELEQIAAMEVFRPNRTDGTTHQASDPDRVIQIKTNSKHQLAQINRATH